MICVFGITRRNKASPHEGWGRGAHQNLAAWCLRLQYLPNAGREEAMYSLALMFNKTRLEQARLVPALSIAYSRTCWSRRSTGSLALATGWNTTRIFVPTMSFSGAIAAGYRPGR